MRMVRQSNNLNLKTMICSQCKNPNSDTNQICEWCGGALSQITQQANFSNNNFKVNEGLIELFIKWDSTWRAVFKYTITVDDETIGSGKSNASSEFVCKTSNQRPSIIIGVLPQFNIFGLPPKNKNVNLQEDVFLKSGASYIITIGLSSSFWGLSFKTISVVKLD